MYKRLVLYLFFLGLLFCKRNNDLKKEISAIPIAINIERFDLKLDDVPAHDFENFKQDFSYMFNKDFSLQDFIFLKQDSLQKKLRYEVKKAFISTHNLEAEIKQLIQHLKYYNPQFKAPKIITTTSNVDYRNKVILRDSLLVIALDTYLGSNHEFYENISNYIKQGFNSSQIVIDIADVYALKEIHQDNNYFLETMIYFGKQLYFKELMLSNKTDAEVINYTQEQLDWALINEHNIWEYFVEHELLFSTDQKLNSRFINSAPFSKFNLELDHESPGRLGQFIGWQIIRSYMKHNAISLSDLMKTEPKLIFDNSKYKPRK